MESTSPPAPEQPDNIVASPADAQAEAPTESTVGGILSSSKTQLAIGVAATLGVMVFYKWREKQLAKKEPEEYARLQRIKASVRARESHAEQHENKASKTDAGSEAWPPAYPSAQSDSPP